MFGCTDASALQPSEPVEPVIFDSVDDNQPIEPLVEDDPVTDTDLVVPDTADPEPVDPEPVEPEVDPNVELSWKFLEVSEEWLKDYDGLGVKKDERTYCLADGVPVSNSETTGLCAKNGAYATMMCWGDKSSDVLIVDERFVIPAVSGTDSVAWYGQNPGSITFVPVDLYGWTLPVLYNRDVETMNLIKDSKYVDWDHQISITDYKSKNVVIADSNGNSVEDVRNINKGETYTVSWDGGQEDLVANWRYYKADEASKITIKGESTDDPEVTKYDVSSLPSGIYYAIESYALIEVKND
jgi:hypothetical protein